MNPEQTPQQPTAVLCPECKNPIPENAYFCQNCGKKIKNPPPSTTIKAQIGIYALSVLAPPFGLVPGIRYVLQKDNKTRMIGGIAIVLTIVSLILTIWWSIGFFNTVNRQINAQLSVPGL